MVNVVVAQMGIRNCGAKDNGLLATTYRISTRHKKKEGKTKDFLPYAELASRQMSNDWVSTSCALCS